MNEQQYHRQLDDLLESLVDEIETADKNGIIDVEYHDGMMNIILEDGKEFVINKHTPTLQLWMSSPNSGAHHYIYDKDKNAWLDTRTNANFSAVLAADLLSLSNVVV